METEQVTVLGEKIGFQQDMFAIPNKLI